MIRSFRTLLCCALSLAAFASLAATASATDFCVGAGDSCDQTFEFSETGFIEAIDAYDASDSANDHLYVAAGRIDFGNGIGIADGVDHGDIIVNGAGSGKTKLVFNSVGGAAVLLESFSGESEVNDLSIESVGTTKSDKTGLALHNGNTEDVYVYVDHGSNTAFEFAGSPRCIGCRAKVSGPSATAFLVLENSSAYVEEGKAQVYDPTPAEPTRGASLLSESSEIELNHTLLKGFNRGIFQNLGQVRIKDSVIDLGDQDDAIAASLDTGFTIDDSYLTLIDGLTVVGTGDRQSGIRMRSNGSGTGSIEVEVENSLIWLPGADTDELYCSINPSATLPVLFLASFSMAAGEAEDNCSITASDMTTGTPTFVDFAGGDYRPAPGSPVIEAGNPSSGDIGRKDFWGGLRYVNGNDFNFAGNIDLGAGEYQNYAPNKPAISVTPPAAVAGQPVTLGASGTDPNGDVVSFTWEFGEGGTAGGTSLQRTYAVPGTYKVKVVASDGEYSTASDWAEIVVSAAPLPSIKTGKPTGKFTYVKSAKNGFKLSTKKPKGPSIKLTTTGSAASATLTLRKKGKKLKGSQKLSIPVGTSYLNFGGRWNKKKLASGKYDLYIDNGSGSSVRVAITYSAKAGKTGSAKSPR